jgi:hypothetical protein
LNRGEPTENTKQDVSINTVDATVQSITISGKKIEF